MDADGGDTGLRSWVGGWGHQERERTPRVKTEQSTGDEMSLAGLWLTAFALLFFSFSVALPTIYEK